MYFWFSFDKEQLIQPLYFPYNYYEVKEKDSKNPIQSFYQSIITINLIPKYGYYSTFKFFILEKHRFLMFLPMDDQYIKCSQLHLQLDINAHYGGQECFSLLKYFGRLNYNQILRFLLLMNRRHHASANQFVSDNLQQERQSMYKGNFGD
ncbi:unnamed protein product [Paramecium octaurelia]|uniref:Uncharacterized protein n=1 Tax=Paramecium octaurelia TaxID=43137 RepID=A0A8S1VCI4_PAROT|nr:unnamed protein product [Paramecium octaurelia]